MNFKPLTSLLSAGLLCVSGFACSGVALAQQTSTTIVPPDAKEAKQVEPWMKIPIPPLHAFHPEQPTRIELKNGVVILLEPDHELPFINGTINIRGGSRDVPADKVGLIGLYGDAWRTSGTATQNGDQLDDLLEAKAAKVETAGDVDSTSVSWSCSMEGRGPGLQHRRRSVGTSGIQRAEADAGQAAGGCGHCATQ